MSRERSIKLVIRAQVDGAKQALKETADAAKKVGEESERAAARSHSTAVRMVRSARDNEQAWTTAGTAAVGFGTALTAGFAAATIANLGFEQSMSGVKAVTNASAAEMEALTQSALDMGAQTAFSASQAAIAQGELAKAGVSTADILGGALKGSMDLAAAGGIELADAATIAAQAMNLYNLEGNEVSRVADVLASGANKSAADVTDLGQALQQAGTVASQTGLSLEETVAALSMFADAGVRGSDAGTSLKTMLQRLTPQSKEAQRVMEELGFSAYDAQGNFIGLEALAGELQDSFAGLDTESRNAALGVAFGSDAIRGASILMEGGAAAAREYEDAMNDQGAAARVAAERMNNLAGDWEEFSGAMETALITGGSAANGFLRGAVQAATDLVNAYNALPGALQGTVSILGGIAGGMSLVGGAAMVAVPKMVEFYDSLGRLGTGGANLQKGLRGAHNFLTGPWGMALGVGVGLLTAYAVEQTKTKARVDELTGSLDEQTGAITDVTEATAKKTLQDKGAYDAAERLGVSLDLVTRAALNDKAAIAELRGELAQYSDADAEIRTRRGGLSGTERDYRAITAAVFGVNVELEEAQRLWAQNEEASVNAGAALRPLPMAMAGIATGVADFALAQAQANGALEVWLPAAERAALLGEEAQEAYGEWAAEMAGFSSGFVSAADALSTVNGATQEWAQAQADATDTAEDSWQDFWDGQSVSVDEWISELEAMAQAQADWESNMVLLSGRVSQSVIDELARLGPEGAPLVAGLVDASDEELARLEAVMGDRARAGSGAFASGMADAAPIVRAAAAMWGQDIADEIAAKLASGEATAAEVVEMYDLQTTIDIQGDPLKYNETLNAGLALGDESFTTPDILGDPAGFQDALNASLALGNDSEATADLHADRTSADGTTEAWRRWANAMSAMTSVGARTGNAVDDVWGLLGWVARQSATVSVYARMVGGLNIGGAARHMVSYRAAGAIERRPMMLGPGYGPTNLIIAGEPETRGEAFISNHPRYRADNLRYLTEAASWFDMALVKKYAAGHITPRLTTPAPAYSAPAAASPDFSAIITAAERLVQTAAAMPQRIEIPVQVGAETVFRASRQGEATYGERPRWGSGPQIGREAR